MNPDINISISILKAKILVTKFSLLNIIIVNIKIRKLNGSNIIIYLITFGIFLLFIKSASSAKKSF